MRSLFFLNTSETWLSGGIAWKKEGLAVTRPVAPNLVGQRFSRLVVLRRGEEKYSWFCACDCGAKICASTTGLRTGRTKSCGCLRLETPRPNAGWGNSGYSIGRQLPRRRPERRPPT